MQIEATQGAATAAAEPAQEAVLEPWEGDEKWEFHSFKGVYKYIMGPYFICLLHSIP